MAVPRVSVLLPVFNARPYLHEALESLGAQTFTDFEVVAVDDGSTDGSDVELAAAAQRWPWLRVFRQDRCGVASALNRSWSESCGVYLARMDADDIARPRRFERQIRFLDRSPGVGICGSAFRAFGAGAHQTVPVPVDDMAIRARLLFGSALAHPSVMFRRAAFPDMLPPYADPLNVGAQDYDLWVRAASWTQLHNLPEVLLDYRLHPGQIVAQSGMSRHNRVRQIQRDLLAHLGVEASATELVAHSLCSAEGETISCVTPAQVDAWLQRLKTEVSQSGWCSPTALARECAEARWRAVVRLSLKERDGWGYLRSPLVRFSARAFYRSLRLAWWSVRDRK